MPPRRRPFAPLSSFDWAERGSSPLSRSWARLGVDDDLALDSSSAPASAPASAPCTHGNSLTPPSLGGRCLKVRRRWVCACDAAGRELEQADKASGPRARVDAGLGQRWPPGIAR